jgi:hypothetical protein
VPDRRASPVDANPSALTPSLSLSLSRCFVGPSCRRRSFFPAPSLSLSRHPHLSAVPNLSPTISPPWTRPRPRVLRPHPRARAPFEPCARLTHLPSLICVLCQTPRPLSRCAHASQKLRHRPPSTAAVLRSLSRPRPVLCHGEFRLAVSCSGHPSVCPSPL